MFNCHPGLHPALLRQLLGRERKIFEKSKKSKSQANVYVEVSMTRFYFYFFVCVCLY